MWPISSSLSHFSIFPLGIPLFLQSFLTSFVLRVLFSSISSSFCPSYPNIPYHISCCPIHITSLLQIFQGNLLSNSSFFLYSFSTFLSPFSPFYILFQILLPTPLHFPDFLSLPMYHSLLWNPSIILDTYPSLILFFCLIFSSPPIPLYLQ